MSALRRAVRTLAWAIAATFLVAPLAACSGSPDTGAGAGAASSGTASAPATGATGTEATGTGSTATGSMATGSTGTGPAPGTSPAERPEPTHVATDAPDGVQPGDDLDVVVSFAAVEPGNGAVEASGYVPGLVEDGGRCVLVLSRTGRADVSVEGEAFADAQSTSCALLSVPVGRLSSGTWTARLDYRSAGSSGSSPDVDVVVP
jgi:hypothetical protein